jgi:hypothetical protein
MKDYAILVFVLFLGHCATAQNPLKIKESTELGFQNNSYQTNKSLAWKSVKISKQDGKDWVRLYKYKNSRIKKALSFTTPRNKAKLT